MITSQLPSLPRLHPPGRDGKLPIYKYGTVKPVIFVEDLKVIRYIFTELAVQV